MTADRARSAGNLRALPDCAQPVIPYASELDGIACVPSMAALPDPVDLARPGRPGGHSGPDRAELVGICRRHGMRLVGPASFGVANPGIGLDATFAARHARAGTVGLALQSTGGTDFTLLEHLSRLGVGISSLVSFGDKDDVSPAGIGWEADRAAAAERFGGPVPTT